MSTNLIQSLKNENSILLNQSANNWKEAVYLSCLPLINSKAIDKIYYEKIIASVEKNGPYFIISDNFAMPHAEHGPWLKRNAFSLITLKEPIYFDNDSRQVRLLVCLSAQNADFHLGMAFPQIVAAFENSETIAKILDAQNSAEVIKILENIDLTKYLK